MGSRIDLQDFQYVLVSINIQYETGGNLAEVLSSLSRIMRDRFRMFKKIRVLSAEGRLSAKILAILPFIFAGFLMLKNPDYYLNAAEDELFWPFVLGALVLEAVGIYIMHRLVNFRV
jgi:tight adherence protein B